MKKGLKTILPKAMASKISVPSDNIKSSDSKVIGNVKFQVIPQSAEKRLFLQDRSTNHSDVDIEQANQLICYELRIQNVDQTDILDNPSNLSYEQKVDYFSSKLGRRIKLMVNLDTIPCAMYHFERNFGVAPYQSIQLGFPYDKDWKGESHHILIRDDYFGFGDIHLESTY